MVGPPSAGQRLSQLLDEAADSAGLEYERKGKGAASSRVQVSPTLLKEEGNRFMGKKLFGKAVTAYSQALQALDPKDPDGQLYTLLLSNRSQARLNLHQFKFALKDADQAVDRDPTSAKAVYRQGLAHAGQHNLKQATESFLIAGSLQPSDPNPAKQLVKVLGGLKDDVEHSVQMLKRHSGYPMFQVQVGAHLYDVLKGTVEPSEEERKDAYPEDESAGSGDEGAMTSDADQGPSGMSCALRVAELVDCKGLPHVHRLRKSDHPGMRDAGVQLWGLIQQFRDEEVASPEP